MTTIFGARGAGAGAAPRAFTPSQLPGGPLRILLLVVLAVIGLLLLLPILLLGFAALIAIIAVARVRGWFLRATRGGGRSREEDSGRENVRVIRRS